MWKGLGVDKVKGVYGEGWGGSGVRPELFPSVSSVLRSYGLVCVVCKKEKLLSRVQDD